jgi:GTP cyclohydrolase I
MNIQVTTRPDLPTREDAAEALRLLRDWADTAPAEDVAALDPSISRLLDGGAYPVFNRTYPEGFRADAVLQGDAAGPAERSGLADPGREPADPARGHLELPPADPLPYARLANGDLTLETSVTGTVSLEAEKKGINMSRIMRSFYASMPISTFSFGVIEAALDDYKADLESFDARIQMRLSFPMKVESLRSGLSGYQYYDIALELVEQDGVRRKIVHLDYVYSSTCPCSLELSEHARATRNQLATPHSQRSVARISVELAEGQGCLWFEDLIDMARAAVPTETQVMVKREDEQAFAELNAANPIFVEDAARLFAEQLELDARVGDFRIVASHQESLHSHDAVSVLTEGETFAAASLDPHLFTSLIHAR